jgi:SAM-dependent methyltransferase
MKCPICSYDYSKLLYSEKERFTNKDAVEFQLDINQCENCGFVFLSSAYSNQYEAIIEIIYKNFDKSNNFPFPNRSVENLKTIDILSKYFTNDPGINILEIGSNRGDLLFLIKERFFNINILGIEPTKYEKVYVPTINSFFKKELFGNRFKFILMQHVLEHILYPQNIIQDIYDLLEDEGMLYLEVPSLQYSLDNCVEDYMLEHVSYFTQESLLSLFNKFEVLEIHKSPFLRVIFKKSFCSSLKKLKYIPLKSKFDRFIEKKKNIIYELQNIVNTTNKDLVFFGTSFYFRKVFTDINRVFEIKNAYFIDDNFKEDMEPNFNLNRKQKLNGKEILILCSNNFDVQNRMLKKLEHFKDILIVMPWNKIFTIGEENEYIRS